MPTSQRTSAPLFDPADQEVVSYRALSSLALAALLAGLLSPLALFGSGLWLVPLVAVVLSSLALWRIAARWPELIGRPAAVAGLLIGTVFLAAAPANDLVYRYLLRRQARQFAEMWIDAVRHTKDDPLEVYKAHHLTVDPRRRLPLESKLVDFYKRSDSYGPALKKFVDEPTLRTLFALGTSAQIRFYQTLDEEIQNNSASEQQIYAVTYPDEHQQPKTFFIALRMERIVDPNNSRAGWTLIRVEGGIRPPGW
jgi:hypothetical protein